MNLRRAFGQFRADFTARTGVGLVLPLIVVAIFFALHGFEPLHLKGLDPFGLGAASGARSAQATQRVLAPFYAASDRVAVVLIDDDYVRARGAGWPLSYAEQGRLLRRVMLVEPAVVVVDLVYPHRHAGDAGAASADVAALTRPIESLRATRPVVFTAFAREYAPDRSAAPDGPAAVGAAVQHGTAAGGAQFLPPEFAFCGEAPAAPVPLDAVLERESIQPELLAGLAPEHLALVRWSGCGARYPLVLGANPGTVTPAFAAFRAACAADARWAPGCAADPRGAAQDFNEPLRLRWGAFPPALQAFSSDARTCQPFADADGHVPLARRLGVALRELTLGLFEDLRDAPRVAVSLPCPAVPVVPLSLLERAPLGEWRELLRGRAVLIGASIAGIPDYVATPVHGQLPGVLLHAMALDNLARDGANYPADRHHEATEILAFVLVMLFAFTFPRLLALLERPAVRRSFAILGAIVWVVIVAACVQQGGLALATSALVIAVCLDLAKPTQTATYFLAVIFAALAAGLTQSMGWTPGNWLGLTLLIIGFGHMLKPFYHGSSASRLPGRYSLLGALWTRWRGAPAIAATAAPHGEPNDAPQSGAAPPPQGGH